MREYQAAVRTKTFIITLILMPVMMGGGIAVQLLLKDTVDTTDKHIAVVDLTGQLYDSVSSAAAERNEKDIFSQEEEEVEKEGDKKQVKPRYMIEQETPATDDRDEMIFALSERVRNEELFSFVIIEADAIDSSDPNPMRQALSYYSNSPTYNDVRRWIDDPINVAIQMIRMNKENLDVEVVSRVTQQHRMSNLGLVDKDESGQITKAQQTNEIANIMIPMGMMMLMFMTIMIGAQPLVNSVLEEKMQRISEVLLGSVPPFQLMMGKLLGMVGVSLTIGTMYLAGSAAAIYYAGYGEMFPSHIVWWFLIFQGLAVLMFGSLFIAVGAAVSDLKEAQNVQTPMTLFMVAPMFVWLNVVQEPTSTFSVVLSLIPPVTPMLMTIRQAVPPGVPTWQPLLGVVLMLITTVICVFVAGRIFRIGILMQGKAPTFREAIGWIARG
ncbi:ABC transporter permease [bacterium AH-315-J04]|nr:ABC transporter permease [bacterium AH-315-J04]